MRYIVLVPDYTGSCIKDEFAREIALETLSLPKEILDEITVWHNAYRKIIPLSMDERQRKADEIEKLDIQGINLAKTLETIVPGGAKVKYFSEGKLKYIPIN